MSQGLNWRRALAAGTISGSPMSSELRIATRGPEETQDVGRVLGEHSRAGDIYLLTGPLGAGKTCLTQGIAAGLDVTGYVRSPTFVLMTRYQGRLTLHHVDLYRLGGPEEVWDLGLEEQLFGDGVCVVEWADRASDLFPLESLVISLDYGEKGEDRVITFLERPERYAPALERLARPAVRGEEDRG